MNTSTKKQLSVILIILTYIGLTANALAEKSVLPTSNNLITDISSTIDSTKHNNLGRDNTDEEDAEDEDNMQL